MPELRNKIAVVTGASSGIGAATASLFAEQGAAVVIVHHDDADAAEKVVAAIVKAGGRAVAVAADVRSEADVTTVFECANSAFGVPDILVNSAGVDASGIEVADMKLEQFENVIATNLVGPFLFCRGFIKGLKKAKRPGKIVNISSVHEDLPRAGASDYCASKGGLRNLTRCLALELAPLGINVNNLAPGMVLTPMNQEAIDDPEKLKEQVESIPLKRAAEPEEVAKLALYLASAASDYATGATFTLDGGLTMNTGQGA